MVGRLADMRKRKGQHGFTLIELLVVIIILGILAAVVVFSVSGINDTGQEAANAIDERTLRTAQEAFFAQNGFYASERGLVEAGFLNEESQTHNVSLTGSPDPTSAYEVAPAPTAAVSVAANEDTWPTGDSGTEPGFSASAFAYPLNSNIHEPLVFFDADGTTKPGLAASWELIPVGDPRKPTRPYPFGTWRFHLRTNVTFHDGSAFDADDVVWTWRDRMVYNKAPLNTVSNTLGFTKIRPSVSTVQAIQGNPPSGNVADSVEKIDQFTVDFTPLVENLRLPEQIAHPKGAIMPVGKHFDGSFDMDPNDATPRVDGTPIGTGPFKFVSYTPFVSASTENYDAYWGEHPKVRSMNYTFIPDPATRTAKLLSGEADLVIDLDPLGVTAANGAGKSVVTAGYGRNHLIYVNKIGKTSKANPQSANAPPGTPENYTFDLGKEVAVRRAVSLAFERSAYITTVFDGNALPGRYMAQPSVLGGSASIVPAMSFNQVLARSTLAGAGWVCVGSLAPDCNAGEIREKAGRRLELTLIGPPEVPQAGYDLLESQALAVGIDLITKRAATNAQRSAWYGTTLWDLDLEAPNQNDANPAFLPTLRFACKAQTTTFRFAPSDGTNGTTGAVTDASGTFPNGNTPCTAPGAVQGPFEGFVTAADVATSQAAAQAPAAEQMRILVGQNESSVVIPLAGVFRIYGMQSNLSLPNPHPSQTSQRWTKLTKT